ncbi:unnamed protein product [Ilex paraguariensis]|uniref:Uncharacterized protein n=1 Tax=Ilex paraguariensis TaxID=185542 RepID=A0ABC8TYN3_9AQUA
MSLKPKREDSFESACRSRVPADRNLSLDLLESVIRRSVTPMVFVAASCAYPGDPRSLSGCCLCLPTQAQPIESHMLLYASQILLGKQSACRSRVPADRNLSLDLLESVIRRSVTPMVFVAASCAYPGDPRSLSGCCLCLPTQAQPIESHMLLYASQ